MPITDFKLLSANFPDYRLYPKPAAVKKLIGGEANDSDITNTCTIRLSHAMNSVGATVPKLWKGITNRRGSNGRYYIIRVANFRTWMESQFGKPDLDFTKKAGADFDRGLIDGTQGVIAFEIGFKDATGHFDLWSQDTFSHEYNGGENYFQTASRISLWTTGTKTLRAPV